MKDPCFRLSLEPGVFDNEWFRALGTVRVLGAGVYLELRELLTTESGLWDHALDRLEDRVGSVFGHCFAVGLLLDSTRVAGVAVQLLAVSLVRREHGLVGIDDNHVVAGVEVWRVAGLVLAAQDVGYLGRETADNEAFRVEDMPRAFDL